ncbi:MAG: T9SS type A sorting domain-containing protein [Ignavibacteria bacterium]
MLHQNYPNPFNPGTKILFDLPKSTVVKLEVYDITGREVSTLANGYMRYGTYEVEFNAKNLSSGVYFYKLSSEDFTFVKKMVLLK